MAKRAERDLYLMPDEWIKLVKSAYEYKIKFGLLWDLIGQAGLRISEALSLRPCDFSFDKSCIAVRTLKQRDKDKDPVDIKVSSKLMEFFKKYFHHEEISEDSEELVWSFSRQYAWRVFKKILKIAGLNIKYSPHGLRHCHGIMLAKITGKDPIKIMKRLRHSSLGMIGRYTHLTEEMQDEIVEGMEDLFLSPKKKEEGK